MDFVQYGTFNVFKCVHMLDLIVISALTSVVFISPR